MSLAAGTPPTAPGAVAPGPPAPIEGGVDVVLELDAVTKIYPAEPPVVALRDVSFSVRRGELVAIVGPSGSGKSTLLHVMGTLERPSAGAVRITGLDVAGLDDRALSVVRATRIGFVFQWFFLAEHQSVLDNVADGLLYAGVAVSRAPRARSATRSRRVGLAHRSSVPADQAVGRGAPARRDSARAGRRARDRARRRADRESRHRDGRCDLRAAAGAARGRERRS